MRSFGKVDKKAMIRNRYNQIPHSALNTKRKGTSTIKTALNKNSTSRIPHPALNTKRERDTYNKDGTNIKTAKVKSQGDSSFPTYGHKAILNKLNSKSKTNRKQTNIDYGYLMRIQSRFSQELLQLFALYLH